MGGWWRWALLGPDGVAPSRRVGVSASVNLPMHHKVQKFSSGTGSPKWSRKKGHKTFVVVMVVVFSSDCFVLMLFAFVGLGLLSSVLSHEIGWEEIFTRTHQEMR